MIIGPWDPHYLALWLAPNKALGKYLFIVLYKDRNLNCTLLGHSFQIISFG